MKKIGKNIIALGIKDGKIVKTVPMEEGGSYKDHDFGDVDSIIDLPDFGLGNPKPMGGSTKEGIQSNFNYNTPGLDVDVSSLQPRNNQFDLPDTTNLQFNPYSTGTQSMEASTKNRVGQTFDQIDNAFTPVAGFTPAANTPTAPAVVPTTAPATPGMTSEELAGYESDAAMQEDEYKKSERDKEMKELSDQWRAENNTTNNSNTNPYQNQGSNTTRIANPYGGVSLEEAFAGLGKGLADKKNPGLTALYGAKVATGVARTMGSGFAAQTMDDRIQRKSEDRANEENYVMGRDGGMFLSKDDIQQIMKFKDGGEMEMSKKLTGNFVEGLANNNPEQAVVEAEDGEFILHNDGQVVEIQGNKHGSKGGEKMTANQVQDGDKFVSNHLKFSKDSAKSIAKEFGVKVSTKDTYAESLRKIRNQIGLSKLLKEKEELIKGVEKIQDGAHENTNKLNLQFQTQKIKEIEEKEAGLKDSFRAAVEKVYEIQEANKPKTKEAGKMEDGGEHGESKDRLADFYNQAKSAGFKGEINLDAKDLGAEAGKLQKWMVENRPDLVVDYFTKSGQPITAKGMDILKKDRPELFEQLGIDPSKPSANYTEEEKAKFSKSLIDSNVGKEFWLNQYQDNKWNWRGQQIGLESPGKHQRIESGGLETADLEALEKFFNSKVGQQLTSTQGQDNQDNRDWAKNGELKDRDNRQGAVLPNLPDQSVLPPNSMASHLKNNYRLNRVEGAKISPEEALAELGSQFSTAMDGANQRPDAMRAGLLAQMLAGTQGQANKAVTTTNLANQQSQNQAEVYNAQIGDKEQMLNNQENLRYEQMQMRAKENTDMDWRDYFDYNRRVDLNNYNTVNQMNMLNELFEKYEMVNGQTRQKSGDTFDFKYQPKVQDASTQTKKKK